MSRKILLVTLFIVIFSGCSPHLNIPETTKQKLRSMILSLEDQPNIDNSRKIEVRDIWRAGLDVCKDQYTWFILIPEPYDSNYKEVDLFSAFTFGVFLYTLDNWQDFRKDFKTNREFNIKAAMRGFEGMEKWYKATLKIKGESVRYAPMDDFVHSIEAGDLEEMATKYVDKIKNKMQGRDVFLIYIDY